ncbi:MAG: LamG domain-containing protein, partial [Opitutaceae bacterium]|nr:LamG domain-containing protein [Opitutaceae bacterium]
MTIHHLILATATATAVLLVAPLAATAAPATPATPATPTVAIDDTPVAIKLNGLTTADSPHGPALVSTSADKDAHAELTTPAFGKAGAPFAVEAWIYVTEHKNPNTLLLNRGRQNCWQLAIIADGRPWLTLWTTQTTTFMLPAKNAVSKNAWHHIAFNKHDDGLVELYIDGKFSDAKTMEAPPQAIDQPIKILPQGFSGQIAGIRIHTDKTIPETHLAEIRTTVAS